MVITQRALHQEQAQLVLVMLQVDICKFVNESSSVQTLYHGTSAQTIQNMGSILRMPKERIVLWKRRQFHKLYASSSEVSVLAVWLSVGLGPNN